MADFNLKKNIDEWVAETPDGVSDLRFAVAIGQFGRGSQNDVMARAWLQEHDLKAMEAFQEKQVAASVVASTAALESAKTARSALGWAVGATIGTIVSAVFAAAAYIKPLDQPASQQQQASPTPASPKAAATAQPPRPAASRQ